MLQHLHGHVLSFIKEGALELGTRLATTAAAGAAYLKVRLRRECAGLLWRWELVYLQQDLQPFRCIALQRGTGIGGGWSSQKVFFFMSK